MARFQKARSNIYSCSFCGKNQHQAARLIAGPGGVYICNECVALCQEILEGEHIAPPPAPQHPPAQPASEQEHE